MCGPLAERAVETPISRKGAATIPPARAFSRELSTRAAELGRRQSEVLSVLLDGALADHHRKTLLSLITQAFEALTERLEVQQEDGVDLSSLSLGELQACATGCFELILKL